MVSQRKLAKCRRVGHKIKVRVGIAYGGVQGLFTPQETPAVCRRCKMQVTVYGWVREEA